MVRIILEQQVSISSAKATYQKLLKAIKELKNLENMPDKDALETITSKWKPWRAVAARLLWHFYLNSK